MRVKLQMYKQKELLEHYRNISKLNWNEISKSLNVSKNTLMDWKSERNLIPLTIFKEIDRQKKFKKYILEIKKDHWGSVKGGKNSPGSTKYISIPKNNKNLAEFIGIMLGDGNIFSLKKGKKISIHSVRIAGDSRNDEVYLKNFVAPLSKKLFGLTPRIVKHKNHNCLYVVLYSIELVKFLARHGIKSGNKIKNNLTIPQWVWKDKRLLKACLRGLIDTDGSVYELTPQWPGLYQLAFRNKNKRLLRDTRKALLYLDFNISRISKNDTIYITKMSELERFYKEIGFNNPKHRLKIEKALGISPE